MKEKVKDRLISGSAGVAAGVVGALGGEELLHNIKEDEIQEEDRVPNKDSGKTEEIEKEEGTTESTVTNNNAQTNGHNEITEIMPVDSGNGHNSSSISPQVPDDNDILIAEINPDEVAADIITSGSDQVDLLAINDSKTDGDIIIDIEDFFNNSDEVDIIGTNNSDIAINELEEDIDIEDDDDNADEATGMTENDDDSLMIDDIV